MGEKTVLPSPSGRLAATRMIAPQPGYIRKKGTVCGGKQGCGPFPKKPGGEHTSDT